jgi:hypothetical protein
LCTPGKTSRSVTHPKTALGQARLTPEFFAGGLPKKKVYLGGMSILSILLSLESGCHSRYPADRVPLHTSFKSREGAERAPTRHHMPYSTEPCFPTKVGSRAATCLVTSDPAFLIGRASAPPRVPWLWIPPPYKGGLRCATCPVALDPTSLQGKDPVHHVSCSF